MSQLQAIFHEVSFSYETATIPLLVDVSAHFPRGWTGIKLVVALGITRVPHIIIMDEPTNHLDLPSILCLEAALQECPCSLLLVSHDQYFLDRLTTIGWQIAVQEESPTRDTHLQLVEHQDVLQHATTQRRPEVSHG